MHKIIYGMVQRKRLHFPPCPPRFDSQHFQQFFSWCCLDLLTTLVRTVYRGLIMSIKLILHWPVARSYYKKNPARSKPQKPTNTCQRPFLTSNEIHWIIFDFEKAKQDQVFFSLYSEKSSMTSIEEKMNESLEFDFGSKKIFLCCELKIWTKIKNPSEMSLSCKWRSCPPTLSDSEAVGNYGWDRERSPLDLFLES